MKYDFDTLHDRTGTQSIKWSGYPAGESPERDRAPFSVGAGIIPMGIADMDFQTAPEITAALVERCQHGIFGYTAPSEGYYQAIIRWMKQTQGWKVEKDWIVTTPGVLPSICLCIQAFTEPGDKIIIQPPVFHPFQKAIEDNHRIPTYNPLIFTGSQYEMDFQDLEEKTADPRVKMMILCSPHNPVGRVWRMDELSRLVAICESNGVLIVADEIHAHLIFPWAHFSSLGALDNGHFRHFIVCSSPTKAFNTPGIKTANAFIPNPQLREKFVQALDNLNETFSVNLFGVLVLQTAYEHGAGWLLELMDYLEQNLHVLQSFISQRLPELHIIPPEATFLVWMDGRGLGMNRAEVQRFFLENAGVQLEDGSKYGADCAGFLRMNIALPRNRLLVALERMACAVEQWRIRQGR